MAKSPKTARSPNAIYKPGQVVPFSGIYDVVDDHGRYLEHQRAVTQNAKGKRRFPKLDDPAAAGYVVRSLPINDENDLIYHLGDTVPCDGIYDVVDAKGKWVKTQKVCRAGTPFPPFALQSKPAPAGYALHTRAVERCRCPLH